MATQPQSRTNIQGTIANFSASANGTAPFSYQWQFNGANIGGATDTSLSLSNVQPADAGNYTVVVTNSAGSVTSAVAVLTVWVPAGVTAQPQSRTNILGTTAGFSVTPSGTAPFRYQWQFNSAGIGGATGSSLRAHNWQ